MVRREFLLALTLALLALGVGASLGLWSDEPLQAEPIPGGDISDTPESHKLAVAFPKLSFDRPVDLQDPGTGPERLYVVEQPGRIKVFPNTPKAAEAREVLNLEDKVATGGEKGLLGMAFHPRFASNGAIFVNYTAPNPLRTVIARYKVTQDVADPGSGQVILEIPQPFGNHNGGQLAFGPDGHLYIAVGDGGSGGDPMNHGQRRETLLGAILRIDVDREAPNMRYAIPKDNPFKGNKRGWREEIWAYGLRNPWRISFDPKTRELWAGDVGQNSIEEIDVIIRGGNYGWRLREGHACYEPDTGCPEEGLVAPVVQYSHRFGVSVTGGHVYRGARLKDLQGAYIYGDFASGRIWSLRRHPAGAPTNTLLLKSRINVSSFGTDRRRALFLLDYGGQIHRLEPR